MSDTAGDGRTEAKGSGENSVGPGDLELLDRSMRDFAEGAVALSAASLRLQMMMLEQMRDMLGDLSAITGGAARRHREDD